MMSSRSVEFYDLSFDGEWLKFPDLNPLVLVSFFIDNPQAVLLSEYIWGTRDDSHTKMGKREKFMPISREIDYGGGVYLIDPYNLERGFLDRISVKSATGIYYNYGSHQLFVGGDKQLSVVDSGVVTEYCNNLFRDLHALNRSQDNMLLATLTGVDGFAKIPFDQPDVIVKGWLATEHGYNRSPSGDIVKIDRRINYAKEQCLTPMHTTHINSVIETESGYEATLFHQGQLVHIDKETGSVSVLVDGLKQPHSVRPRVDAPGRLLSDTNANRSLFLNDRYEIETIISGNFKRVQDAIQTPDGYVMVADSNNERIVLMDKSSRKFGELRWKPHMRKIYTFSSFITVEQAREIFYGIKRN